MIGGRLARASQRQSQAIQEEKHSTDETYESMVFRLSLITTLVHPAGLGPTVAGGHQGAGIKEKAGEGGSVFLFLRRLSHRLGS